MTRFSWSPLIESAVVSNAHLYTPLPTLWDRLVSMFSKKTTPPETPIGHGVLAIHVRRGDYEEHCKSLAKWGSLYHGWLQMPSLPDRFLPPAKNDSQEYIEYYARHCWPSIPQIVERIAEVKNTREGRGLRVVYVMTNGDPKWLEQLKVAIVGMRGGWDSVTTNRDLVFTPEQKYIAQAVDMAIGSRAQVFIGNGVRFFKAIANRS